MCPAAGLAYSKKLAGVFDTVGVRDFVVDLESWMKSRFRKRKRMSINPGRKYWEKIPETKKSVYTISDEI